jgi:hypothetical protein
MAAFGSMENGDDYFDVTFNKNRFRNQNKLRPNLNDIVAGSSKQRLFKKALLNKRELGMDSDMLDKTDEFKLNEIKKILDEG